MKRYFSLFFLSLVVCCSVSQDLRRFRVMEWNCENLFDTLHDYGKDDREFLPDGDYRWDTPRYWTKQRRLASTILDAGGLQPVDLIGMCEVENDSVMHHLLRRTRLARLGYEYVMTESADQRGIDVALVYQPYTFRLVAHHPVRVPHDAKNERPTRDVLWASGIIPTGDTLDVVVVHFPSRRGGRRVSEPYRLRAAGVVRQVIDSVCQHRQQPAVIVMGDCNDEPDDASLRLMAGIDMSIVSDEAMVAGSPSGHRSPLRHIHGTYCYQGLWSRIDNILVSTPILQRYHAAKAHVFAPDYLLEADKDGYPIPYRTYRGPSYHGGVSDHLPLTWDLWY